MYPDNSPEPPIGQGLVAAGADLLRQLHIAIIRLDDKTGNLVKSMEALEKTIRDDLKDHETRIRSLENRPYVAPATVWKVIGTCIGVLSLAATVVGLTLR